MLRFRLSERVPKQKLYRRLAKLLDWDFLYEQTQALYSHTGQPSLDPVVFFKLMLVSRLENLVRDRRLIEHCSLQLDILYFLGYEVDEGLPCHSTISRTRHLYPAIIFEHVFAQCVAANLVTGYTQAVYSAFVKANASLDSLCEKQPADASTPKHHLRRVAAAHARYARHDSGSLGRDRPLSNKIHYIPADPDARISVKLGKARALNYLPRIIEPLH